MKAKSCFGASLLTLFFRCLFLGVIITLVVLFVLKAQKTKAANCGGAVVCACGDTVTSSYTLTGNLTCTGNGLRVGAAGITIDGGGFTITGDGGADDYGIYNLSGYSGVTIRDFDNITNFNYGIYITGGINNNIQNVTANANNFVGIILNSGSGHTVNQSTANNNNSYGILVNCNSNFITNNTANSNLGDLVNGNPNAGIYLNINTNSNTLTGNTTDNNSQHGIGLFLSNNNTLTSNSASGNRVGNISNISLLSTGNAIDTTNLVEGKPVYYLSNISDVIYDGVNAGMFNCFSCTNVTIKNTTLATNNNYAIAFKNSTGSVVQNNIIANSYCGIFMSGSVATISGNSVSGSDVGLTVSNGSVVSGNTIFSNKLGLSGSGLSGTTTISNNQFLKNGVGYTNSATAVFQNNHFFHDLNMDNSSSSNRINMLRYSDTERTYNPGETINFSFSTLTANGVACDAGTCSYSVAISPTNNSLSSSLAGDTVSGSFVPNRSGIFSLLITVTDGNGNETKRNVVFLIGSTFSSTTRYYFRSQKPTHSQPRGNGLDTSVLKLTAPSSDEFNWCSGWVQYSPDDIPEYPFSSIYSVESPFYYKLALDSFFGVQRYVAYNSTSDSSVSVSSSPNYLLTTKTISNLNFMMDYLQSWYSLKLSLGGNTSSLHPQLRSTALLPSYTDITYSYTTAPTIKTSSNNDILILSATATDAGNTDPNIVLNNPTLSSASTTLTLDSITRPFINGTTAINSSGSATVSATLAAGATTTLNTANMVLAPSSGSVTVDIATWNTSGTYSKEWTENGSAAGITTGHTVGNMNPNTSYTLSIDGILGNYYVSNGSGEIAFNYTGGYSAHTFALAEEVLPTSDIVSSLIGSTNGSASTPLTASNNDTQIPEKTEENDSGTIATTPAENKTIAKNIGKNLMIYSRIIIGLGALFVGGRWLVLFAKRRRSRMA